MATRTLLARGEATYADVKRRASGSLTINSTSWTDVDNNLDIVLTAVTGDKVEVSLSGHWGGEGTDGYLDVATVVSGSPVTYFSPGTGTPTAYGTLAWYCPYDRPMRLGGSVMLVLVSGDVSGGQVRLRLRGKTADATNKTLHASTDLVLVFSAKNLGPG